MILKREKETPIFVVLFALVKKSILNIEHCCFIVSLKEGLW